MATEIGPTDVSMIPTEVKEVGRFAYSLAMELRSGAVSLDQDLNALLASWKGLAADSYAHSWQEMHTGAIRVWDELLELAEKLGVTAEGFQAKDSQTADHFGSLALRLDT
ncbi:WXG100 family type VII secretion target [Nocardia cyriacigeorgica]|uniref:WXG100 family type VII secretion target n=2 Tax=Nocardia TaxID=1817 RepID=UPI0035178FA3